MYIYNSESTQEELTGLSEKVRNALKAAFKLKLKRVIKMFQIRKQQIFSRKSQTVYPSGFVGCKVSVIAIQLNMLSLKCLEHVGKDGKTHI